MPNLTSKVQNSPRANIVGSVLWWLLRLIFAAVFLALVVVAYRYSIHNILHGSLLLGLLVLWVLIAYITLPRVHRQLTKIYLPDYYVGRARTTEGLLGDHINVAVFGSAKELRMAMLAAGWVEADRPNLKTSLRLIRASIFSESYPEAPGFSLYLFGQPQAFSFQKEQNGNPRNRHHVRFWKTPTDWWLPGGFTADWLGAAHHDKHIGFSLFTGQITHKITENIDKERDLLVADLRRGKTTESIKTVPHFSSGLHGRNGGGDRIITDGAMPFIHLLPAETLASDTTVDI